MLKVGSSKNQVVESRQFFWGPWCFFFQYSAVLYLSIIALLPMLCVTTKVQKNIYRCKLKNSLIVRLWDA